MARADAIQHDEIWDTCEFLMIMKAESPYRDKVTGGWVGKIEKPRYKEALSVVVGSCDVNVP